MESQSSYWILSFAEKRQLLFVPETLEEKFFFSQETEIKRFQEKVLEEKIFLKLDKILFM